VLSAFFRHGVTLARAAPDDFTIDQYHPDVKDADPAGYRDAVVEQKLGSAFFTEAGLFPCVGVYAVVQASGALRTGDIVSIT
jgi:hypothetical protein